MPWRFFPWTREMKHESDERAREAKVALSLMETWNERLRESRDRIRELAEALEANGGRGHRPEHG